MALGWNWLAEPALTPLGVALLVGFLLVGCGSGVPDAGPLVEDARRLALSDDPPLPGGVKYVPRPTVTFYPTFTPAPTLGPTNTYVPTPTTIGFLPPLGVPKATATPFIRTVFSTPGPTATALPTPVFPSGGVYGALLGQTFFGMYKTPEVGESMPSWPEPEVVFLVRTTRFLVWYLLFDHSRIDVSKAETCLLRVTVEVGPTDQRREHVLHQEQVDIDIRLEDEGNVTQVILGLGDALPGFWTPGDYKAELWDSSDRVVAQWDFKVG